MIQLGVNTVLFKAFSLREAARAIKLAGYDGMELSAIKGMCEHLDLDQIDAQKAEILDIVAETGLKLLSTEVTQLDEERLRKAYYAAGELGIPIVNVGSGGKSGEEDTLLHSIDMLSKMSELAEQAGVTLCVKAHVGASIYNTQTTLQAIKAIKSSGFGIDMDPSHVYRAQENPEEALPAVLSRTRHIHIRDCKGRGPSPGEPMMQACGRGDIDLFGYFQAMTDGCYDGPVSLEVIGPELDIQHAQAIASESYGYMNACLKKLGAR